MNKILQAKLIHLPDRPGVYRMRDETGTVLYVGKAKSLRARVRSYFASSARHSLKTEEMLKRVVDVDTLVVDSEAEALILENNLIKEHNPRFNVRLKDDKGYPYIKVTLQEPFPRVFVTRHLTRDGAKYFGPYTDVRAMRHALDLVKKLFTVRSCRYRLPDEAPDRACLDYHIGLCLAPCVGLQSKEEYREMIGELLAVLNGQIRSALQRLEVRMQEASARMDYEQAARYRDLVHELRSLEQRQAALDVRGADRDVIALARDKERGCGVILKVRDGRLLGREVHFFDTLGEEGEAELLSAFVVQVYSQRLLEVEERLPPEILLPHEMDDQALFAEVLRERVSHAVHLHVPQRGAKLRLVHLAETNARHVLEEASLLGRSLQERAPDALFELQAALEMASVPRTMVCFDISHTQGSETVAACVFFENGVPKKAEYRKMKIRGDWGNDDYRSMHEAVTRYFLRRLDESLPLPDLVVIDGGKGQLGAAVRALDEIGLAQQAVISLAKQEEEVFLPGYPKPLRLPRRSEALRLLQRARDEAHRFSLGYNRTLRSKRTTRSVLSEVPGVGPAKQKALLSRFGSVRGVRGASVAELTQVPGISRSLAEAILSHLRSEMPESAD